MRLSQVLPPACPHRKCQTLLQTNSMYLAVKMVAADTRLSWFWHDTVYCLNCKESFGCVLYYKGNNTTPIDTSQVTQTGPQQLRHHSGFISSTLLPIWDQLPFAKISSFSTLHFHLLFCTYFSFNCIYFPLYCLSYFLFISLFYFFLVTHLFLHFVLLILFVILYFYLYSIPL
jgi:hypothetical protein